MGYLSFLVPMFCAKVFETNRLFPSTSLCTSTRKCRYKDYPVFHLSFYLSYLETNLYYLRTSN